jgi:predicted transcriptional regulator
MGNHDSSDEYLKSIVAQLEKGVAPQCETVRTFLGKFGFSRRGYRALSLIRQRMENHKIITIPDIEQTHIDGEIRFAREPAKRDAGMAESWRETGYRLAILKCANVPLVSVTPDATLQLAVTLMLANDYSQLPILRSTRDIKGVISWKAIGSQLALKHTCPTVGDCMYPAQIMDSDESLFTAIAVIRSSDYVLVRQKDRTISGIVTASDLNDQFRQLAEPFLVVGEIENGIRGLLQGRFTGKEIEEVMRGPGTHETPSIDQLAFGDYMKLLHSESGWKKFNLQIDRTAFLESLNAARLIRNDIMHFSPDGIADDDIEKLRRFAKFLGMLREMAAVD